MKEPTIFEAAHIAHLATLGWRINTAETQDYFPLEFIHDDYDGAIDGNNHLAGYANSWQEAINQILEIEGIEA